MDELEEKWGAKYQVAIDSWRRNSHRLTTFRYDKSIRKLIYTTNTIKGFHRQVRKVTKTRGIYLGYGTVETYLSGPAEY